MPTPNRLPIVNSDDGVWGDILRQYLMKEHYNDDTDNAVNGGHQKVTIRAGTSSAAPLTFTSGTNLTTAAAGSVEYDGTYFYLTPGSTRQKIAAYTATGGATGDIYYRDSGGNFTPLTIGGTGTVLTVSGGIPSWSSAISNASTITVKDANFTIQDDSDTTKQTKFELSGLTTGHTTTLAVPEINGTTTIVGTDATQTLTNKTLTTPVINGTPTGTGVATTATASTLAMWDANKNLTTNTVIPGTTSTATAAQTITMDITYTQVQVYTGTSTATVKLPTTSIVAGQTYTIINQSSGAVAVQSSGGNAIVSLAASRTGVFTAAVATPTTAANWSAAVYTSGAAITVARTDAAQTFTGVQTFSSAPSFGALPTGSGVASAATASTLAARDSNANLTADNFIATATSTATAAGTTTMDINSAQTQVWTGTTTQTVRLPTTSIVAGQFYTIVNQSTGAVAIQTNGGTAIVSLAAGTTGIFTANTATPTAATHWNATVTTSGTALAPGDVSSNTTSSVDSEVALFNGTTGKSIKRATITGIAKLTSGVLSAATAGTDYVTPAGAETLSNKTLTTPQFANNGYISDSNGNELIVFGQTASAVNEIKVINAATTLSPVIAANGGDTNISLDLQPKGTGRIKSNGVNIPTVSSTDTLTSKTIDAGSNTITGLGVTNLGGITGTASSSTYLRGDGTWATPSAGGGMTWTEVTGTSQSGAVDSGYITNNAALVTVTLPSTAAVGKIVSVGGKGAGGWRIAQNSGQTIHFGNMDTTAGTGGRLDSTHRYDAIELICITANTDWLVRSSVGNITVT